MTRRPGTSIPIGRPALAGWQAYALVCLCANLAAQRLEAIPDPAWIVLLGVLGVAGVVSARTRLFGIAALVFLWTVGRAGGVLADRLPSELSGSDFDVTGWVDDFPEHSRQRSVFSLRVVGASSPDVPARLRLSWYEPPVKIEAGERVALRVRLRSPRGLANPGGFDYERWLLLEGYGATGYVRGVLPAERAAGWNDYRRAWLGVRAVVVERVGAAGLSRDAAALVTALTVGVRAGFSDAHWDVLRRTGTSHLVAISGMHVGLLAGLVFWIARRLCLLFAPDPWADRDLEIAATASAIAAGIYAALAGFALPTQRALVMVLVALWLVCGRRTISSWDGYALALVLVVLLNPLATTTASFWLSFGAVATLLLLAGGRSTRAREQGVLGSARNAGLGFVRLQWAVTLGLVPLLAVFFGELSLVAPLVNLVAIPFFSLLLVPAALAATSWAVVAGVPSWSLAAVGLLADTAYGALSAVARWPFSAFELPQPSPLVLVSVSLCTLAAIAWHRLPGRRLAALGLVALAFPVPPRLPPGQAEVTVLDVGHGLAVLVRTAGHYLLYDAGPRARSGFDVGAEVAVPALRAAGATQLDRLIVSHADNDHAGGVASVVAAFPGVGLLKGPDVDRFGGVFCEAGQQWTWDGVSFEMLHPSRDFAWRGNESSCVLRIATASGSALLAGDIESVAERVLVSSMSLQADVVVVPHHGSATSSSPAFVAAVGARHALVSAGHDNRWGFPKTEVAERWIDSGARLHVTGDSGALRFRLGADTLRVVAERDRRKRYWSAESRLDPG